MGGFSSVSINETQIKIDIRIKRYNCTDMTNCSYLSLLLVCVKCLVQTSVVFRSCLILIMKYSCTSIAYLFVSVCQSLGKV